MSPMLFILCISPLFKLGSPLRKFGYADSVVILATHDSLHDNCCSLSNSLGEVLEWGKAEGITFDPEKSELMHFSRLRNDKDSKITSSVTFGSISVSENRSRPYTRWLRVYFDKSIFFKWLTRLFTGKEIKVANALRCLPNTSRGASLILMRQAVLSSVLPIP